MSSREEAIAIGKELLENSSNVSNVVEISNEQVWNSIKRNILHLSNEFDSSFTDEEIKNVSNKADAFNKFAQNALRGIGDDYAEKHRTTEYALREEDIRVRKAHEINEAIRLTQSNPEASNEIISGMMKMLNTGMSTPRELIATKVEEEPVVNEVIADVKLSEE